MADRLASPRTEQFPAPGFPVYGLVSPFGGARCLELFGDPPDGEPHWVSLWHQSADGRSVLLVTTYTRRGIGSPNSWRVPTDEQAVQYGIAPLESLAGQGTHTLIDLTLPVLSLARPPGLVQALIEHAQAAADAHAEWATVEWRVDSSTVQAPTWSFADGWAGFTDAAEGVYVSVVGIGPAAGPEGLALAALSDSTAYHFDLHAPLSLELAAASREAADIPYDQQPLWKSHEWHPDQLRLMNQLGSDTAQ
jgi:hypothetical protein